MDASDDWEILQPILVDSSLTPIASRGHDRQTLIRPDYFALGSNSRFDHDTDLLLDSEVLPISEQELGCGEDLKQVGFEAIEEQSEGSLDGDFGGNQELGGDVSSDNTHEMVFEERGDGGVVESSESSDTSEIQVGGDVQELKSEEKENKGMVLWKLPFEIMKFCVFRVSPAWTISIAAAIVGYVILKKRLSRMRAKSRTIPIKLTVEDKKVSQFMTRATRLNEAFSVVKRVTIMRPLLPAAGATPWPMLNLR